MEKIVWMCATFSMSSNKNKEQLSTYIFKGVGRQSPCIFLIRKSNLRNQIIVKNIYTREEMTAYKKVNQHNGFTVWH